MNVWKETRPCPARHTAKWCSSPVARPGSDGQLPSACTRPGSGCTRPPGRQAGALADLASRGIDTLALDVTDEPSMTRAVASVEAEAGAIGVLIHPQCHRNTELGGPRRRISAAPAPSHEGRKNGSTARSMTWAPATTPPRIDPERRKRSCCSARCPCLCRRMRMLACGCEQEPITQCDTPCGALSRRIADSARFTGDCCGDCRADGRYGLVAGRRGRCMAAAQVAGEHAQRDGGAQ
jgi:hypothetical protein